MASLYVTYTTYVCRLTRRAFALCWGGDAFNSQPNLLKTLKVVLSAAMSNARINSISGGNALAPNQAQLITMHS